MDHRATQNDACWTTMKEMKSFTAMTGQQTKHRMGGRWTVAVAGRT